MASKIPVPTSGQTQKVLEHMVNKDCGYIKKQKTKIKAHLCFVLNYQFSTLTANQLVDLDDFVEITKNYAQGIVPPVSPKDSQVPPKPENSALPESAKEV